MTRSLRELGGHVYVDRPFPRSLDEVPDYLANLDPMTAGLILLAGCAAYLVWAGSDRERAARRSRARSGRGVTLPPDMVPKDISDPTGRVGRR